jgi:hypothetical protein
MPNKKAVATGNWSNTATWDGGTLPDPGDDVYSNGFTVTIDTNITVASIRTQIASGISAGGGFNLNNLLTCNADIHAGSTICVTFSTSNGEFEWNGNINGGSTTNADGIRITATSALCYINGNVTAGSSTTTAGIRFTGISNTIYCVGNTYGNGGSSSGISGVTPSAAVSTRNTLYLTGDAYGGSVTGGFGAAGYTYFENVYHTGNAYAHPTGPNGWAGANVHLGGTGSGGNIYLTGNVYGGASVPGILLSGSGGGIVEITGLSEGGDGWAGAFNNSVTGTLSVITAKGGVGGVGVHGDKSTATTTYKYLEAGPNGMAAYSGYCKLKTGTTNPNCIITKEAGGTLTLVDAADIADELPLESDVRFGVVYNSTNKTGSAHIPAASSVSAGVPVDNTVGTAVITLAALQAELAGLATQADITTAESNINAHTTAEVSSISSITPADVWTYVINGDTAEQRLEDASAGSGGATPADIWNHLISNISTPDSIGERLKNCSTVQTTGDQIASF